MKFPILLLVILSFTSCSKYARVIALRCNAPEMDTIQLLYANDSFSIQYNFYGNGPVMRMRIFNKLDIPLVADWAQSSIVLGIQTINYLSKPEQLSNIPPHSFYDKVVFIPININFLSLPLKYTYKHKIKPPAADNGLDSFKIQETDYTFDNSPFKFRNYLSLSYDPSLAKMFHLDQQFWICDVKEMNERDFHGTYNDDVGEPHYTEPFLATNCFFIVYVPNQ